MIINFGSRRSNAGAQFSSAYPPRAFREKLGSASAVTAVPSGTVRFTGRLPCMTQPISPEPGPGPGKKPPVDPQPNSDPVKEPPFDPPDERPLIDPQPPGTDLPRM